MIPAAPSSGSFALVSSRPTSFGRGRGQHRRQGVRLEALPPLGGDRVKTGGAHGDDLDRVVAFDRGECIARIDRAHEGIGGSDLDDVGDLRDIEQRRDRGMTFLPLVVAGARM